VSKTEKTFQLLFENRKNN